MFQFFFFIVLDIPYLASQQMKGMSRTISLLIFFFSFFEAELTLWRLLSRY